MTAALLLIAWVVVASYLLPHLVRRRTFRGSPAAGVAAWQALSLSVVVALLLAGLALATASDSVSHWFAGALQTCELLIRTHYSGSGALGQGAGAALTALVLVLLTRSAWTEVTRSHRTRQAWATGLSLVARPDASTGALVLPHPVPAAYCVPGRHGRHVVVTSAALDLLDAAELGAVVAHEQTHLRWRHHVVVATAAILAAALPWLPVFRYAHTELQRLVELMADDAAAARCSRATLARALSAITRTPAGTIAARAGDEPGPTTTAARIARLQPGAAPAATSGVLMAFSAISVATPAALFALPLAVAALSAHCGVGVHCG